MDAKSARHGPRLNTAEDPPNRGRRPFIFHSRARHAHVVVFCYIATSWFPNMNTWSFFKPYLVPQFFQKSFYTKSFAHILASWILDELLRCTKTFLKKNAFTISAAQYTFLQVLGATWWTSKVFTNFRQLNKASYARLPSVFCHWDEGFSKRVDFIAS